MGIWRSMVEVKWRALVVELHESARSDALYSHLQS